MELKAEDYVVLRQYLLGQLAPARRTPLEERLLTDAAFHDELSVAEDELIDRYLAGELAAADRQDFETHFLLGPERHKKLRFARALRRYVATETDARGGALAPAAHAVALEESVAAEEQTPGDAPARPRGPGGQNIFRLLFARHPAFAFAVAASLLLAVAAVSWVALAPPARRTFEARRPYAVTLTPGLTRGSAEPARVQIPADADALRLRLELPATEHEGYHAALLTDARAEVWAADELQPAAGAAAIEVDIPTSVIKPGDYQVKVGGRMPGGPLEDVSRYTFRVIR